MKIYFDESQNYDKSLLLIGAIFIFGEKNISYLQKEINKIKVNNDFFKPDGEPKEIKYNKIATSKDLKVAKQVIDLFFNKAKNCYFRCCVIGWSDENFQMVGKKSQSLKLKRAILYTDVAKKLIYRGIQGFDNAILLYDDLVRCRGDKFEEIIENNFGYTSLKKDKQKGFPLIKTVRGVKSDLEANNIVQLTDLFTGCVLNNNEPSSKRKNDIRDYLIKKLGFKNLLEETWKTRVPSIEKNQSIKFHIDYLKLSEDLRKRFKKRKNRS